MITTIHIYLYTVTNIVADADADNTNKKVIFKNCAQFTSCISRINNTQINDAQYIDILMPMYNFVGNSNNYSKASGIVFQFCRDVPVVDNNGAVTDLLKLNYWFV